MPKSNFNQFLDECENFTTNNNVNNKISFENKIANILKNTHKLGYTNLLNSFYFRYDLFDQFKEKVVFQPTCLDEFLPFKEWHYKKMLFENEQKKHQHETTEEIKIEKIYEELRYENFLLKRELEIANHRFIGVEKEIQKKNISAPAKINREIKRIINKVFLGK